MCACVMPTDAYRDRRSAKLLEQELQEVVSCHVGPVQEQQVLFTTDKFSSSLIHIFLICVYVCMHSHIHMHACTYVHTHECQSMGVEVRVNF